MAREKILNINGKKLSYNDITRLKDAKFLKSAQSTFFNKKKFCIKHMIYFALCNIAM